MRKNKFISLYLLAGILLMGLPLSNHLNVLDFVSAAPIVINGDWTVTGNEAYNDNIYELYGDLTIEDGGHLILNNCTLRMMSQYLQPYEIIVQNNGTLEIYDCYITDTPDDDDSVLLSAYYYFIAREGSTLIVENSTIRQNGFIDLINPEHLGLSVSTNSGHISNSRINSTIIGLAFFGNNSGFYVEDSYVSQIGMTPIMLNNAEGVILSNISFFETEESSVVDAQYSNNFLIENFNLGFDQHIQTYMCSGFKLNNIISNDSERVLEIRISNDFELSDIHILESEEWNSRIDIEQSTNFTIDNVSTNDNSNVINLQDCSFGTIKNLNGFNVSGWIEGVNSDNITITDSIISGGEHVIRFTDSQHITLDRIDITNGSRPIYYHTVNESSITNFTITGVDDTAVTLSDYSANITVSSGYIETDSQNFVNGIWVDYSSDIIVRDIETYNINLSLWVREGDIFAEDIIINGTMEQDFGIRLEWTREVYLANISMLTDVNIGIHLWDSVGNSTRVDNLYINDAETGIYLYNSNISIENITIDNAIQDIMAQWGSYATVMNSTLDLLAIWDSDIVIINTTNTTAADFSGISQLVKKWWVDVYVDDKTGPIAGAEVSIIDGTSTADATGVTGSDGFARNLAATEVIWTWGSTADDRNPHETEASGPGWFVQNATLYQVDRNMRVNVTFNGNAPPFEPTNLVARSDDMSSTILTWDPSISLDVVEYDIYMAKTWSDLWNYVTAPVRNPNATVPGTTYTHLEGSANWDEYFYAVTSWDGENKSDEWPWTTCGDWVVNSTSPQFIENMIIELHGSLLIFGNLDILNTTLEIKSPDEEIYGIFVNDTGSLIAENLTVQRKLVFPYYFKIQPNANVVINASKIKEPGTDDFTDDESIKGIHSLTENLTVTNTTIEVRSRGLGIYGISDLKGLLYNISFSTSPSPDPAEYYIKIKDSSNVSVSNCNLEGWTLSGIHAETSYNVNVYESNIKANSQDGTPARGIYFVECTNSRIFNNPLIRGVPAVHITSSINTTIENSNISGHGLYGIYAEFSSYTTVKECYFDSEGERPDIGIFTSWCSNSVIVDMVSGEINFFVALENESSAEIRNLNISSGDIGINLINSNNVYVNDTYFNFIQQGMLITGCRDIYLYNTTINLTLYGMEIRSPGPINIENCEISNCISGEIIAEGFEGEGGTVLIINSTINPISDTSLALNNSAVVYLLNTSFNLSKLWIGDSASRLELYHYLSIQVYDIDNNIPLAANITIVNSIDNIVFESLALSGYAEWILIHEKTVFRDNEYLDNPHNIYVFDGSHFGNAEVYINYSQHLDVQVSNQFPIITLIGIIGYYDNPFPIPDDFTILPKTNYDIILTYTYEDPENDPESGTIIHWYVNGVYNSTLDQMTTITPQYTQKGQLWQAYVYPSDGYNSTYPFYAFETNIIPILNTPPSVANVTITPTDPTGGDDLYVTFDVYDLDDDGLDSSKTTHKWYIYNDAGDNWIYSTIDSFYLPSQYTSKNQIWACVVTPHDGDNEGQYEYSQNVTIGNTPPSIQYSRIVAESGDTIITGADDLKVQYIFSDPDDDSENGTAYEWYRSLDGTNWTKYDVNFSILSNSYSQRGDLWRCRILPSDGEDFGQEAWTDPVEIFNTPPVVSNVTINPQNPTSSDSIEVTYDFYDYDGDSDNGTSFRWIYEDAFGVGQDSGISGNVTSAERVFKGQTWFCYVTPSDGISVGLEVVSGGVLIQNTPPEIADAQISLVSDDMNRWLMLDYSLEDIDGDSVGNIEIRWIVDDNAMPQFDNSITVPGDYLVKGEGWNATLRGFDGEDWSEWYTTASITIPNKPPKINGTVSLIPQRAQSNENLVPEFEDLFEDEDGDTLTIWEIKWYKDNGHMEDYNGMQEIQWVLTQKGEIWFYKVRVYDGNDFSDWYSSTTTVIENSPPSNITQNPVIGEIIITEKETAEFNASAVDIDEDALSYRWTLDGRIVLLEEGVSKSFYNLKTDYDSEGEYILRLIITDGDDTSEITWTVNVEKLNRLPKITVVEPEGGTASIKEGDTLNFAITKSDEDGDNLDVTWYIDGVMAFEGSDKYTFSPDYSSSRIRNITAEVSETESGANSTFTWNVQVADVVEGKEEFMGLSYDWWGLFLAVLSGVITAIIAAFGLLMMKHKKDRLKEHMLELDRVIEEDEDPDVKDEKLTEFQDRIKEEFSSGQLDDLHFLLLQEVLASKRGEIRKAAISEKFERLPEGVVKDLDDMLKDGKITKGEYESFVATISKSKTLSPREKEELSKMIEKWEDVDKEEDKGEDKEEDKGEDKEEDKEEESEIDNILQELTGENEEKNIDEE